MTSSLREATSLRKSIKMLLDRLSGLDDFHDFVGTIQKLKEILPSIDLEFDVQVAGDRKMDRPT